MINFKANEDILPLSEFRSNLAGYITQTRETGRPIIVTQNGRPTSVVLSIVDWEACALYEDLETIELLDDIRVAEEESDRGEVMSHDEFVAQLKSEGRL